MNTDNLTKLPPPEQTFEWPQQAAKKQDWKEASRRWAVLRKAYPRHPATWLQGALAHIEAGELPQADALLEYARHHFPNNPNTLIFSYELSMRREEWGEADIFLQQARQKYPESHMQIWMKSSEFAEHQGDLEHATAYNVKARQCGPDHPDPFIQYAELAMRAEQWEQALERWDEFRSRFPDAPAGYLRAAEAARKLGWTKEARQLTLANQYGMGILDNENHKQHTQKQLSRNTHVGQLLELIWTKSIFDLHSEVTRSFLSYSWWVLEPLVYMATFYLVFGLLLQRGGENYPVFLLAGLIPWMWFMKAVSGSSNSIIAGQDLMLQVGLSPVVFPLVKILQATLKQIPVFILLFAFLWLQGFTPGMIWLALIPTMFVQALLIIAFAGAVASVIPFVRDLSYLVPTGLTFLMFFSGVFYDYRTISAEWQSLFLMNPITFLLKSYREILIDGTLPDMQTLAWWGLGSAVACGILILVYKRLRYIYPRIVME